MAVFHQQVAHVAELRLLATPLAEQPGIGIGGRGVGHVRALLTTDDPRGCAPPPRRRCAVSRVLRLEALHAGPSSISVPSTEKCSSESSAPDLGRRSTALEELGGGLAL
jgi:hypothetical protein